MSLPLLHRYHNTVHRVSVLLSTRLTDGVRIAAKGTRVPNNEDYGTFEAPLNQENDDPVSDFLYTSNFALLGLHEAAAALGDPKIKAVEDKLADFIIRIQARSTEHPDLDGAFFRAFDCKSCSDPPSNRAVEATRQLLLPVIFQISASYASVYI